MTDDVKALLEAAAWAGDLAEAAREVADLYSDLRDAAEQDQPDAEQVSDLYAELTDAIEDMDRNYGIAMI